MSAVKTFLPSHINDAKNRVLVNVKELNLSTCGEEDLWKAVIFQALTDATSNSSKRKEKIEKANAISWLSGRSPDFKMVASLAGFELNYLQEKIREALLTKDSWKKSRIKLPGKYEKK